VWLVTCDPVVQRSRVVARGTTEADAERRITAQDGLVDRVRPVATRVVDTSGSADRTRTEIERLWAEVTASR
jgi:dephospho-CoA kinase